MLRPSRCAARKESQEDKDPRGGASFRCKHKYHKILVEGEYECTSSSGYCITPELKWCTTCGAYQWEQDGWELPSRART